METANKKAILVVDDEKLLLNLFSAFLARAGYEVITADSGMEGINQFLLNKYKIGLILADVDCKAGFAVDGPAFFEKISEYGEVPPTIFMTGYPTADRVAALLKLTGLPVLEKPFELATLSRCVHSVLNPSPASASSATAA